MVFNQGSQRWVNSPDIPCGMIKMVSSSGCVPLPDMHIGKTCTVSSVTHGKGSRCRQELLETLSIWLDMKEREQQSELL